MENDLLIYIFYIKKIVQSILRKCALVFVMPGGMASMRLDCCEWLSLVILQEFLPISTHSCKITNSFPAPSTVLIKIRLLYIVSPELILFALMTIYFFQTFKIDCTEFP